jgi:hypothetical protein
MTVATKHFNGVELGAYGLATPSVSGAFGLPDQEIARLFVPGRPGPNDVHLRSQLVPMRWSSVVYGTDHADLCAKLLALEPLLSPSLGWCALKVQNRSGLRTMARCKGFPLTLDKLPYLANVAQFDLAFERYPYWEDDTAVTATIATAFLTFRQATFEHTALDGWHSLTGGLPTLETTDPYAGTCCMKVVAIGGGDTGAKTPEAGITGITAAEDYSLQMMLKGAAGGETVTAAIRFFKADDSYISEGTANLTLTDEWALYKLEGAAAPALAEKASVQIRDADASTFYVDQVCLEEAATCGSFFYPADANTRIYNDGDLAAYPVYTCTLLDTMASGLHFHVGSDIFTYTGALVATDSLVVTTDLADVELNGTRDFANTDPDADFPTLAVGNTVITLSDPTKFTLGLSYRRRYL